jgi:hypothetical protein
MGGGVNGFLAEVLTRAAFALLELLFLQFLRWVWNAMRSTQPAPQPA